MATTVLDEADVLLGEEYLLGEKETQPETMGVLEQIAHKWDMTLNLLILPQPDRRLYFNVATPGTRRDGYKFQITTYPSFLGASLRQFCCCHNPL